MKRILVAGIGNIFLGDDAFGVEVIRRLLERPQPDDVHVVDFGVRGRDLAYALLDGYAGAILVDATCRGQPPGTLFVLEPEPDGRPDESSMLGAHATDPATVLHLARSLGGRLPCLRLVGCEPASVTPAESGEIGLSEPVCAAVDEAVRLIETLVRQMADVPRFAKATGVKEMR